MRNNNYSVLLSVYYKDNPLWLKESINSMLNQTIKPNDFVIVEDGILTEELEKVIVEYENKFPEIFNVIRYEINKGLGPALAIGVEKCKNKYIARMDADDIAVPNRIEKELLLLEEKKLDIVGSNIAEFIDKITNVQAVRILPEKDEEIKKYSKRRNPFGHPSVILNKEIVLKVGNYRNYYLCEDYDMWIRMIESGAKTYNIQEVLVYMRINEDFYKRRGGLKYLKSILKFKKEQYNKGYYKLSDFLISSSAHVVMCLIPNKMRDLLYRKILRKQWR